MSGRLTRSGYEKLVAEDIAWLKANAPDTLERQHILLILEHAVAYEYGPGCEHPDDPRSPLVCRDESAVALKALYAPLTEKP